MNEGGEESHLGAEKVLKARQFDGGYRDDEASSMIEHTYRIARRKDKKVSILAKSQGIEGSRGEAF